MAVRVTDAEVKEIINTTLTTTPFIAAASLLVDTIAAKSILSDAALKEIERWLSAHLVAIRDQRAGGLENYKVSEAEEQYTLSASNLSKGLGLTPYGQQALAMDTTGTLVSLGKARASFSTVTIRTKSSQVTES